MSYLKRRSLRMQFLFVCVVCALHTQAQLNKRPIAADPLHQKNTAVKWNAKRTGKTILQQLPNVPTDLYVNDNSTTGDVYTSSVGNDANDGSAAAPFATITHALSVAAPGSTIFVDAGSYVEDIVVETDNITLKGSNAGIDPNSGTRNAESVLYPATSDPDPYSATYEIMMYLSGTRTGITIDGFTFDGDNPALTSGVVNNGADVDAGEAIGAYEGLANTSVIYNIIKNTNYAGVDWDNYYSSGSATSGNTINHNKLYSIIPEQFGIGIVIYDNCYTYISDNTMSLVRVGIQTGNFYQADPGNGHTIINNNITSARRGIWHNLAYQSAATFMIENNTLGTSAGSTNNDGIMISSLQSAVGVQVLSNTVSGAFNGYQLWNCPTTSTVAISGGTITNCSRGIFANNYDGYISDAASSSYIVSGVQISGGDTAIYVKDNALNSNGATVSVQVKTNTTIAGSSAAIGIVGGDAHFSFFGANPASINSTGYIIDQVSNGTNSPADAIDATTVSFDGATGASKSTADLFAIEDKITHKTDDVNLPFVTVKTNNVFVTQLSGSVQRGVDIAAANWMVHVGDGTYNEDVTISKTLTVEGQSHNTIIRGLYSGANANTVLLGSNNDVIRNLTITRDYGTTLADWYACTKNQGINIAQSTTGVTIDNVVLTGNRNAIFCNNAQNVSITNCIIENNRTGVHYGNNISGAILTNNFIRNNFTHGVLFNYDLGVLTANNVIIENNDISGNWYAQINFQRNIGPVTNVGSLTGTDEHCNWYGTAAPTLQAVNAAEPGYGSQVPTQFGGSDPGLHQYLMGTEAAHIDYTPWLTNGTDDDAVAPGFQPTPGSCGGTPLVVSLVSATDALCHDSASGHIDISVSGGSGSYTYSWSNDSTTQDLNNVAAGSYTVTVTDTYGQSQQVTASIGQPDAIAVSTSVDAPILCNGGTTTVSVTSVTGGTSPYTYNTQTTVGAGNYSIPVTDAHGCNAYGTGSISQPSAIIVSAVPGTIECPGGSTSVAVSATGGTPGYTGVGIFSGVAGPNTYTVTDANACTGSTTVNIADGTGKPPKKPGTIDGTQYNLCGGGTLVYTINAVSGATSYTWTVPAGFTLVQNNGTSAQISVPAIFNTAQIAVAANNNCGTGNARTLPLYAVAPNPGSRIDGPTTVTANQSNLTFKLPALAGLTYTWSVPGGASITSGQGTNKIKVDWGTQSGQVKVFVSNPCGSSPTGKINVSVVPGAAIADAGSSLKTNIATVSVSPNPAKDVANIAFSADKTSDKYEILISDVNGKALLQKTGATIAGRNIIPVNISNLANGVYMVRIVTSTTVHTVQLVKE